MINILISLLLTSQIFAISFEEYQKQQTQQFKTYQDNHNKEFEDYKNAFDEEFKKYKQNILKNWNKPEVSTNHKWVQYNKDFNSKKVVDFKNKNINLEVIAKDEKEASQKLSVLLDEVLEDDIKSAYKNDILEKNIYKKLKKTPPKVTDNQTIIKDIIDNNTKLKYKKVIKEKKLEKVKYNDKFIYKVALKMPPNSTLKKARLYTNDIKLNAKKQTIDQSLIYAIIHSESSFNPMARSHIPAFGLMQIVPRSAGIDSYYFLYGKKKVLPSTYLYNSKNNIKIGSAYLHILYYKYLKSIKNPTSRLLCTICAYNTGAGNVSKAFIGNTNIKKASLTINELTPKEVYKTLMRKLPYMETKKYLKKVYDRNIIYEDLIKSIQAFTS